MKSSNPESAKCMSSNTRVTVPDSAIRSKNVRHAPNSWSGASAESTPSNVSRAGSTQLRSVSSLIHWLTVATTLARVVASSSLSISPQRLRTISPNAQKVMPSPYDGDAAVVPVGCFDETVDVLEEFPRQARLADARPVP